MKRSQLFAVVLVVLLGYAIAPATLIAQPVKLQGASCERPPVQHCPDSNCPRDIVTSGGAVVETKTGRTYFLDYPCDLKPREPVTFVLNLHGGGSYGNWQRHYFPIFDYVDTHRLVVATPFSPRRVWAAEDDAYLQNIVTSVVEQIGRTNIKAFWLAGHSQGGATARRLVCADFFKDKVDGFLSLSGGRVGGAAPRAPNAGPPPTAGATRAGRDGAPVAGAAAAGRGAMPATASVPLTCEFSHIYTTGEHEIASLPNTSEWAQKYSCGPQQKRGEIVDEKAGYVYDGGRQNPGTKQWGLLPRPGKADVFVYPNCGDGRVVADVVRLDKGHTEGLEPNVTEELVKLMLSARGGKIAQTTQASQTPQGARQAPPPQPPGTTNDPFPAPIAVTDDVVKVSFREFASLPDVDGQAARTMHMVDEPGTRRLFASDMRGILYSVGYDGQTVTPYLDLREAKWEVNVQSQGRERGFQSFAFHPQFNGRGTPGFGKFYAWTDTSNTMPTADFTPGGGNNTHDTVLLEWTAKNPAAATYDGGPPRELLRLEQPFPNHNGGHITFNPMAAARDADFGMLYVGVADGGSGGDPLELAQNLSSPFGKILRIDPLGKNSANGKYGFPSSNPFASDNRTETLGEIYAYGVRNPQRLFWDSKTRRMFMSDIGQNIVEEISPVTAGANLGWNDWEGSFRYVNRFVSTDKPRSDPNVTYPVAEYGQLDPLLQGNSAAIGGLVYRHTAIPQLAGLLIFGDNPSGEIFYVHADKLPPNGGQDAIRRILLDDGGEAKTLLQIIKETNAKQRKTPATRADLRFGLGPDGQVFLLNKADGIIRLLVPNRSGPTQW